MSDTASTATCQQSMAIHLYNSCLYCNTSPICIGLLLLPLSPEERAALLGLLPFLLRYASHLYRNNFEEVLGVRVTGVSPIQGLVGNPWPCYRGHLGFSGQKLQIEFENGFPALPAPGPKKSKTAGSKKESKSTIQLFWLFFDSVSDFLGPRTRRAGEPIFELYLQLSARKAQMTPVAGPEFSQGLGQILKVSAMTRKECQRTRCGCALPLVDPLSAESGGREVLGALCALKRDTLEWGPEKV